MSQVDVAALCRLVEKSLCEAKDGKALSAPVHAQSKMGDPPEWDSLAFVSVFLAVSESYSIEVSDDDAIHFISIPALHAFLEEVLEE